MSFWQRARDFLVDPNLIALMLSIGLIGIVVELWNPGLIFPGTVGAISLILGLYGLQVLPVSLAGLFLMLLAAAFFVAEAFVPTHGALTLAGAITFVLGALMLFDPAGDAYQVSLPVALAIAGTLTVLLGFAFAKVVRVRRRPPAVGTYGHRGRRRPSSGATAWCSSTASSGVRTPPTVHRSCRRARSSRGRRRRLASARRIHSTPHGGGAIAEYRPDRLRRRRRDPSAAPLPRGQDHARVRARCHLPARPAASRSRRALGSSSSSRSSTRWSGSTSAR